MYNFLFALQQARESWGAFLTPILFVISEFAYYCIIVIVFLLYLCVDKKKYTPLLFTYTLSNFFMSVIKLTACIPRPWIHDNRLHPHKLIVSSSTGYSFPSGHTTGAASFYGILAVEDKKNKNRLWFRLLMCALIILTAFSRMWLGAHTPLDVCAAIILGLVSIALVEWSLSYIKAHPDKDYLLAVIIFIMSVLALVYFSCKSYPAVYNADGELIVDTIKMQMDGWQSTGMVMGISICWLIDNRYIHFTTEGLTKKRRIIRGIIAGILFALLYMFLLKKLEHLIDPLIGSFLRSFVTMIICTGVYPALFTNWEKKHPQQCC